MSPEEVEKPDTWPGPARYQQYFEIVMLIRRLLSAIALSIISSENLYPSTLFRLQPKSFITTVISFSCQSKTTNSRKTWRLLIIGNCIF